MDPAAAREHLLDDRGDALASVEDALSTVAADIAVPADRATVVARQRAAFEQADLFKSLVDLLVAAVDAAGGQLPAEPVAAPPYVVVTGRGPMLRGATGEQRLVVLLQGFELDDGRYRPVADGPTVETWVQP